MKYINTNENFFEKGFDLFNKISPRNQKHYQRTLDDVIQAIESGRIRPTEEEVKGMIEKNGGMRVPFSDKKATGKFAEKGFSAVVDTIASKVLADALKVAKIPEEREDLEMEYESKTSDKHLSLFEEFGDAGFSDIEFLVDQLSNSMEFFGSAEEFAKHIASQSDYDEKQLLNVFDAYWKLDPAKHADMMFDWEGWIEEII